MFDNLNLQNKFLAVAAVPVAVLVVVALLSAAVLDRPFLAAFAALGAIATVVAAYVVGRAFSRRFEALNARLADLTERQLPDAFRPGNSAAAENQPRADHSAGGNGATTPESGHVGAGDELTALEALIERIPGRVGSLVEEDQKLAADRLTGLVSSMGRRHQSLLDRQMEHIDWLERTEEHPDRLEQLFKLDHLATRLRRSIDSVLVVAEGETRRPRSAPALLSTVLRVAMGATDDFTQIRLCSVDEVMVQGDFANDLSQLVAELLDNATQYSSPTEAVEVHAVRLTDGTHRISITDRGIGMNELQLADANATVGHPPELTLAIGRSLGFVVVGRLARRLDALVELEPTAGGGVTASVVVPAASLVHQSGSGVLPGANEVPLAPADIDGRPASPNFGVSRLDELTRSTMAEAPSGNGNSSGGAGGAGSEDRESPREQTTDRHQQASTSSSDALSRLLGLSGDLPTTDGDWSAPAIDRGRSDPLKNRDTGSVPPSLQGHFEVQPDGANRPEPGQGRPDSGFETGLSESEQEPLIRRPVKPGSTPPKRRGRAARTLNEAIPSGAAFESGVEDLLAQIPADKNDDATPDRSNNETVWSPPPVASNPNASLARRQKGAPKIPTSNEPRVRASSRKPEEIRSMIARYRDGLKGSLPVDAEPNATPVTDPVTDNREENE